ncbi:MAG TPA: hypothetical protein VMV20_04805 [Chitinophagaceae bacterium]|nr:hypothetical protein [Chitinophagaceae bacterium]
MRKLLSVGLTLIFLAGIAGCSLFRPSNRSRPQPSGPPVTRKSEAVPKAPEKAAPFNVAVFATRKRLPSYHVAVFAPLYLSQVSDPEAPENFPSIARTALPGLEFYEGIQIALDTLRAEGYHLDVDVYDTKSEKPGLEETLRSPSMSSVNLILGSVNMPGFRLLSSFARSHQVNFISVTYPNDGDLTDDPFLVICNSTLRTHCEAIHHYVQENFGKNKNILLFYRNTPQEKRSAGYILESWKDDPGPKIPIHEVEWMDSISTRDLSSHLVRGKNNVCIVSSLNESAARNITSKLASLAGGYEINVMGMPNWDGIRDFFGPAYRGIGIFYSTPYYNEKKDRYSDYINASYSETYKVRPTDMVFKGFEAMYYFCGLMQLDGIYFNPFLNDSRYQTITPFDFEPVYHHPGSLTPDYFENKYLYFIKIFDGAIYKAG